MFSITNPSSFKQKVAQFYFYIFILFNFFWKHHLTGCRTSAKIVTHFLTEVNQHISSLSQFGIFAVNFTFKNPQYLWLKFQTDH